MPPRKPTDKRKLPAAIATARDLEPGDMTRQWLDNGGDARITLTPERAEVLLVKVSCGMTVKAAATELGINPGVVNQRAYDDPSGFGVRLRAARQVAAPTLFETMLEVAFENPEEDPRTKKLKIEVLDRMAKVYDRANFGEQKSISVTTNMPVMLAPIPDLPDIDAEFSVSAPDDDDDDDDQP
jgi:hypothetical protein